MGRASSKAKKKREHILSQFAIGDPRWINREMPKQMLLKAKSKTRGRDEDHSGARPKARSIGARPKVRSTGVRPEGRSAEARSGPKVKAEVRRGETRGQRQGP